MLGTCLDLARESWACRLRTVGPWRHAVQHVSLAALMIGFARAELT